MHLKKVAKDHHELYDGEKHVATFHGDAQANDYAKRNTVAKVEPETEETKQLSAPKRQLKS